MQNTLRDSKFCIVFFAVAIIGGTFLVSNFLGVGDTPLFCTESISDEFLPTTTTPMQLDAILHYATSQIVPQQSIAEITVSFNVLQSISPCNFLVFGLGHDSLMWASFNANGKTLFLEEDVTWVRSILKTAPNLNAAIINYLPLPSPISAPPTTTVRPPFGQAQPTPPPYPSPPTQP